MYTSIFHLRCDGKQILHEAIYSHYDTDRIHVVLISEISLSWDDDFSVKEHQLVEEDQQQRDHSCHHQDGDEFHLCESLGQENLGVDQDRE